jgi:hypothetical protein
MDPERQMLNDCRGTKLAKRLARQTLVICHSVFDIHLHLWIETLSGKESRVKN